VTSLFKNILVAINGSEGSIHAAQYAILMAKQYHCTVTAVYVVDSATVRYLALNKIFIPEEARDYEKSLLQDGQRYLNYVATLGRKKGVKIDTVLRQGAVWTEVVLLADEIKANLILLGGVFRGSALGLDGQPRDSIVTSFTEIISHAPCSVLVVHEKLLEHMFNTAPSNAHLFGTA
jgi:nucleotide-binding universal stress UspA family protein